MSFEVEGYDILANLASGKYGKVYGAQCKETEEFVAVKSIPRAKMDLCEISMLRLLDHENVIKIVEIQWDCYSVNLVLEYCDLDDLRDVLCENGNLAENDVQKLFQQLGSALQCLRSHNIVHMDLKPENILMKMSMHEESSVVKLADFGLSQFLEPGRKSSLRRGTDLYMAPEIHSSFPYDASVDLWSAGIVLYECLFGDRPFGSVSEIMDHCNNQGSLTIPSAVSDTCKNLLDGLLQPDPAQRISFDDFFNHPFMQISNLSSSSTNSQEQAEQFESVLWLLLESFESLRITFQDGSSYPLEIHSLNLSCP